MLRIPLSGFQNLIEDFLLRLGFLTSLWVRKTFPELLLGDLHQHLILSDSCPLLSPYRIWSHLWKQKLAFCLDLLKVKIQHYLLFFSAKYDVTTESSEHGTLFPLIFLNGKRVCNQNISEANGNINILK